MEMARRRIGLYAIAVCAVLALTGASVALASSINHVKVSLSPKSGKGGDHYTLTLTGRVTRKYEQLALTMVTQHGKPCPSDYAKGFQFSEGLANAHGQPIGPMNMKLGDFTKKLKIEITNASDPGPHAICAYLVIGSKTLAHGGAVLTILPAQ